MLNKLGRMRIEQDAETDQLTVMLFADEWFLVPIKKKSVGKKACQLALAA